MSGSRPSIRNIALKLARESDGSFGAKDVVVLAGCTTGSAQIALSQLASEGKLQRVARGFYARPGLFTPNTSTQAGPTTMARGLNDAANRALEDADAFLKDCPPLPACRPVRR
jgi:predicted transcriptional regulator of viral defense system